MRNKLALVMATSWGSPVLSLREYVMVVVPPLSLADISVQSVVPPSEVSAAVILLDMIDHRDNY